MEIKMFLLLGFLYLSDVHCTNNENANTTDSVILHKENAKTTDSVIEQKENVMTTDFVILHKVLLRAVKTLTFYSGQDTFTSRTSSVPQLQCVGDQTGCRATSLRRVECENIGWDAVDGVKWWCKAYMNRSYQFDKLLVSCEGFSGPDDPVVLEGSCGLVYSVVPASAEMHWFIYLLGLIVIFILSYCEGKPDQYRDRYGMNVPYTYMPYSAAPAYHTTGIAYTKIN